MIIILCGEEKVLSRIRAGFVSSVWVSLLLVALFGLVLNVPLVKGDSGTIYIRADGSIDPPTAQIQRDENVYTLTGNIYDEIVVQKSNITIDGKGYTLQGYESGYGFYLYDINNVTIRRTNIKSFGDGIFLQSSSGDIISGNNISNNKWWGISSYSSSNNDISRNNIANNANGIWFTFYSQNNSVSENNITVNDEVGLRLDSYSNDNSIRGNLFVNGGLLVSDSYRNVAADNFVNGKPLVYLEGISDRVVEDAGQVVLIRCNRIWVKNLSLSDATIGVELWGTTNTKISGNNIMNNRCWSGIFLYESHHNDISGNNITANDEVGLWLEYSSYNNISGNNVANNGIGIRLDYSSYNNISGNNVANSECPSIYLDSATSNLVYHNNFIDNGPPQVQNVNSMNTWDDGYPSGGNYWSDYTGIDQFSSSYQNETGSDRIGDTPYIIDGDNRDRYPFMKPRHDLNASITAPASIELGSSSSLKARITNSGMNDETDVKLLLLINGTIIDSTTVSLLLAEDSYALNHLWIPTIAGTYNVTAYVLPLPGEANTQNNRATEFVTVYAPQPPVASFTYSPSAPFANKTVTFDASAAHDPDGSIVSYDWEFGDGTTGSEKIVTHAYANAGAYTVTLTVTDNEGETDTETSTLTISTAPEVSVKAGDWIKVEYVISGAPSGTPLPQWLKVEFLSVEGTSATARVTMRMSDGTEQNATVPMDVVAGGQAFGLSGFLIPANSTTGDSIYMSGYGNVTIAGETTRTYVGASRTVVYASISQYGTQLTYYWDKQTGVLVEASAISGSMTSTAKATETNMWQAQSSGLPFDQTYLYILAAVIIAIAVGAIAFVMRRKRNSPEAVTPTTPTS